MIDTSPVSQPHTAPCGCFITGTDTDTGKTLVTAGLLRGLLDNGTDVLAVKAVQTGCVPNAAGCLVAPDTAVYAEAVGSDQHGAALELFEPACSPHLAAQWANRPLCIANLHARLRALATRHSLLLVEGAGGVLVPMNDRETMLDLMAQMALPVILVVHNRLGCLNHALLSLESLRGRGLAVAGIVCNNLCDPRTQTELEQRILNNNVEVLTQQGGAPVVLAVPYLPGLSPLASAVASTVQARQHNWDSLVRCLAPLIRLLAPSGNQ